MVIDIPAKQVVRDGTRFNVSNFRALNFRLEEFQLQIEALDNLGGRGDITHRPGVDDLAALRAVAESARSDMDIRVVDSQAATYIFDAAGSGTDDGNLIIVPDVGSGIWIRSNGAPSTPFPGDKDQVSAVTSGNGSGTGVTITTTPANGSFVDARVNGHTASIGDGVKTEESYFSNDGGTTARLFVNITAGDEFIWNGVKATFDLDANDTISFYYNIF